MNIMSIIVMIFLLCILYSFICLVRVDIVFGCYAKYVHKYPVHEVVKFLDKVVSKIWIWNFDEYFRNNFKCK